MDASFETGGQVHDVADGTAHFLEHMAFETDQGNALALFARLGVRGNAFTSSVATAYYFTGTDNFWPALRRLVELVAVSRLTPKGVEAERRVIAQEIRMYEDSPASRLQERLLEALYVVHPIRRSIAGTLEAVEGITPDGLRQCHATFYHPSNLVFVAAGDLDPERVFDAVEGEMDRLGVAKPGEPFRRLVPDEPLLPASARTVTTLPVKRPSFALGWKDRPFGEDGPEALFRREVDVSLLADVVFGPTSELFTDLYRAGLIDESFSVRYACDATFAHAVAGGTTRDADLVSERLLEGISRWRQKGITWPELQRKRRKAHGQFVGLFDSLEGMATLFLMYRLKGINLFSYPDVLETTRLEEVNRAFGELFAPERVTVATVTPG